MGWLDKVLGRHKELDIMYDLDLLEGTSERLHMKRLAIQTCVDMIGRIISQSEFRVREGDETYKDEMYYRLNVRPNENMSASHFWHKIIHKLIHDNECLIVQADSGDLLVADDFHRVDYGIMGDKFKNVLVNNFTFNRTFDVRDVLYFKYDNENLSRLFDGIYADYGELIGRMLDYQKHKNQIRATVDIENINAKDEKTHEKIQNYINTVYKAANNKSFALFPQQKGFTYEEHSSGGSSGQSIEEINKATNGFLDSVAKALGIPVSLLHGDMADVEKPTRNFMTFCIDPLLKKIRDELNAKFIKKKDFLNGKQMDIRRVSYSNIFDVAQAVDKLRSSGVVDGNELREKLGLDYSDDPIVKKFVLTKNYTEDYSDEGGDNNEN